jgi:hypothetical protein
VVRVDLAAGGRAYALRVVRLSQRARGPTANRAFLVWGPCLTVPTRRTFRLLLGGDIKEHLGVLT